MDYRIMVAEDEPKLREVVCDYLLSRGDVPVPAGDGLEALALAEEDGNFDAVVLDVMPSPFCSSPPCPTRRTSCGATNWGPTTTSPSPSPCPCCTPR